MFELQFRPIARALAGLIDGILRLAITPSSPVARAAATTVSALPGNACERRTVVLSPTIADSLARRVVRGGTGNIATIHVQQVENVEHDLVIWTLTAVLQGLKGWSAFGI